MINSTDNYKLAIVGDTREIFIRSIIEIISPDIVYGTVSGSPAASFSLPEKIHDKNTEFYAKHATLERNHWPLDGSMTLSIPANAPNGFVSSKLCDNNGRFLDPEEYVDLTFSNVSILQACSIFFPDSDIDGYAVDFIVEIMQDGVIYYSKEFVDNKKSSIYLSGFTVYEPDTIRVSVQTWSLPNRRMRVPEIIPGIYEKWDGNVIASISVKHQGDVSCLTLPYGTASIMIDNLDRRFEPRNKAGIFQSIEERQAIPIELGVRIHDGTIDYKPIGMFYQSSGGWKTGNNTLTMQWNLVDIIGLVANREYVAPAVLPTTLDGWAASIVSQLGEVFSTRYIVDPNYKNKSLTVSDRSDIVGMKCGDILRYICMASGTWPRADSETGYLAIEPLWSEGNKITLDNLNDYPTMKANEDIAAIIFTLNDGNKTQYVMSGNSVTSSNTKSITNPFIKTQSQALTAAKAILANYGGNLFEIVGRGDMSSEIGDVDTIWLDASTATTARRTLQNFVIGNDGVLKDCGSTLLQADGSFAFQNREVITQSGSWTAPSGATSLRLILVGKGENGTNGTDGTWEKDGLPGADGIGGKVWYGTININPGQIFSVSIGDDTVFGAYSSANGHTYPVGYTDIASGDSFGRTGVTSPLPGSGDGGTGGRAGAKGNQHEETYTVYVQKGEDWIGGINTAPFVPEKRKRTVIDNYPLPGGVGAKGAYGCVVVYWDN